MSNEPSTFEDLIARARAGSQEAARSLIARCGSHVFRAVRRRLPRRLRPKFDSGDFSQMAWASTLKHPSQLGRFERSQKFLAFVAAVATNKVRSEIRRRFRRRKYDVRREYSLDVLFDGSDSGPIAQEPRPSQMASAREELRRVLDERPAHYRRVLDMRARGFTAGEIAGQTGLDEGTVRRILRTLLKAMKP